MKIAILDDYASSAMKLADWSRLNAEITVFTDTITDPKALAARFAPFDVLCLMRERTPLTADLIAALPNLKLIVTSGPKNAAIDLAAATAHGIPVSGTQSRKTTTSELSMLMMLALNRRLIPEVTHMANQGWQQGLGRDLAGLTLGLIGLGNIGAQMAALGRAFGMEIVAWSQNLTDARASEVGAERMASLPALMARADVSSVHLVLSDRSRGLVGADAFAAAKPGHVFINTSRGPIVDTGALLAGLRAGKPQAAGIDVYDQEPLPLDHPLRDKTLIDEGRLLLTPHLGYTTQATFHLFHEQTVEAIAAWAAGNPGKAADMTDTPHWNKWDDRYDRPDYLFGTEPSVFLLKHRDRLTPGGTALAVADGEGRNSVWLAKQGMTVTAFDNSERGLDKARTLARDKAVSVDFRFGDIEAWNWAGTQYDTVAAIFIQFAGPTARSAIFRGLDAALRPGGLLFLHGFAPRQVGYGTGGPPHAENMYTLPMLHDAFPGYQMLHTEDYDEVVDAGPGHNGRAALIDFVARKPERT